MVTYVWGLSLSPLTRRPVCPPSRSHLNVWTGNASHGNQWEWDRSLQMHGPRLDWCGSEQEIAPEKMVGVWCVRGRNVTAPFSTMYIYLARCMLQDMAR